MPGIHTLYDADDLRIGVWGNVFLTDLIGRPTLQMAQDMGRSIGSHARQLKRPYVLLQILRAKSPPPEGEVRQALINITTAGRGPLKAFVTLAVGPPIRQSIARSVMANFALAAPADLLIEVTQDPREACRLCTKHGGDGDTDLLLPLLTEWAAL